MCEMVKEHDVGSDGDFFNTIFKSKTIYIFLN